LWQRADELPDEIPDGEAGAALLQLHCALADFSEELPALSERLDRAASVVSTPAAVPRLAWVDRAFLAERFAALRAEAESGGRLHRVLHGGPHTANLLATREGPRWIDFDTACRGPLEWDLAHLGGAAALFPEADAGLLARMRKLVSAEVAIWCWHTYGRAPEVDEAAHYHLEALRERGFARPS
jgi:Ser/Thr protein kinase RdoA (MazF antagonist)